MTMTDEHTITTTAADWTALARAVGAELRPGVAAHDQRGEISVAAFEQLRAAGLTSALVPV